MNSVYTLLEAFLLEPSLARMISFLALLMLKLLLKIRKKTEKTKKSITLGHKGL